MNQGEWASYKSALKVLDRSPKAIKQAKAAYDEGDQYMKANQKNWSENGRRDFYAALREKRDQAIQAECKKMESAVSTLRSLREYPGESIDLNSTALQNALRIIEMMKGKLPYNQQISIAESFRGQPATLTFLADVYETNGINENMVQYVRDMAKPLSLNALEEMEAAIYSAQYTGDWNEGRVYWVKNEFARTADRLGYNMDGHDPYTEALRSMKENAQNPDEARAISSGLFQLLNASDLSLSEADRERIFNETMEKAAAASADRELRETAREASTYRALEMLEAESKQNDGTNGGNENV